MIAIDWKPSRQAALPLYRQIYLFIQSKIQSNQWTQGTILPPQRELANKLDVNRSTLTIAIEELIADGYLTSRQGSGIKVSGSAWAEITAGSRSWNDRLSADAFLSNQPLIQKINELEFAPGMIRLGTGELAPELFPRSALQRLIAETAPEIDNFGYQEPQGLLPLREEISHHLAGRGIETSPASILIVSGALQALQLICFGLLKPHDAMFIERPSYLLSLKLFRSLQLHFSELPMTEHGLSLPDLIRQQQQHRHESHAIPHRVQRIELGERKFGDGRSQINHQCLTNHDKNHGNTVEDTDHCLLHEVYATRRAGTARIDLEGVTDSDAMWTIPWNRTHHAKQPHSA
mgnify:CR=1 FL=1